MTKTKSIILSALMLFSSASVAQAQEFESATSAVTNMRLGWNLGNTLDSNSGSTTNMWIERWTSRNPSDYETAWGQPVATENLIKMFKQEGFNAIRVPVTWYPHMGVQTNGLNWDLPNWKPTQVNAAWMKRVKEIVDYVIKNDMYCIINVHHDTGSETTGWIRASMDNYNKYKETFEDLWRQIATEFKDYDQHLLFEGYNEMLDNYNSWCFASFAAQGQYNATSAADSYKAINSYAQSFVDVVRATGGNNATRNLIINDYAAACPGSWNTHLTEPLKNLDYPKDDAKNHIIFQLHYYPSVKDDLEGWTKPEFVRILGYIKTHLQNRAPVIFGEWGTANDVEKDKDDYFTSYKETKLKLAKYIVQKCKEANITTFYWMGLCDGADRTNLKWTMPELKDAIVKGYYGENGYTSGINEVTSNSQRSLVKKCIYKGKVMIVKGDGKYNVAGVRVK